MVNINVKVEDLFINSNDKVVIRINIKDIISGFVWLNLLNNNFLNKLLMRVNKVNVEFIVFIRIGFR